jgi:hypothetical protein
MLGEPRLDGKAAAIVEADGEDASGSKKRNAWVIMSLGARSA